MKKVTIALLLTCALTACTDTKTIKEFEAYCQKIDSTTMVLKRANNVEEFKKITSEFAITAKEFENSHKDAIVAEELLQQVRLANNNYLETARNKVKELKGK